MVIAYLVAAATAAIAAYGGQDFPKHAYWQRWDSVPIFVALAFVYLLYALTGVGVTAVAEHAGLRPLNSGAGRAFANGATYGVVALAFLRLEIASLGLANLSPAKLLLTTFLTRVTPVLDNGAARSIARRLGDLQPLPLCRTSWRLYLRHVEQVVNPIVAAEHATWLREHHPRALVKDVHCDAALMTDAIEAQERLRYYAERLIIDHEDATIEFG